MIRGTGPAWGFDRIAGIIHKGWINHLFYNYQTMRNKPKNKKHVRSGNFITDQRAKPRYEFGEGDPEVFLDPDQYRELGDGAFIAKRHGTSGVS